MWKLSENSDKVYNSLMQIIEMAAKLQTLGLTDKESRVYVAALFLGPSSVQKIAEQAGINRPTAYDILDQLGDYGLMSQSIENKKSVYLAEGPDAIERWLDNEKAKLDDKKKELKAIAPELVRTEHASDSLAPTIRFFKGADARVINGYLRRKARPKTTIYSLTNIDDVLKVNPEVFATNPTARLKKQISTHLFYSYTKGEVPSDKKLLRETKKLSEPIAAEINLYETAIDITTYDGDDRTGIIIESEPATKALRQIFELAWTNQKRDKQKK